MKLQSSSVKENSMSYNDLVASINKKAPKITHESAVNTFNGVRTELVEITPKIAEELLKANTKNRCFRHHHASQLAGHITRGEWQLNGDTIRIAKDGTLLDGQHRLGAVLLANKPITTLVVTGLDNDSFETIDNQRMARNASHVFSIRGIKNYSLASSTCKRVFFYINHQTPFFNTTKVPSVHQLEDLYNKDETLKIAINNVSKYKKTSMLMSKTLVAFCYYVFFGHDPEKCESFFHKLNTGSNLDEKDPVLVLRNMLLAPVKAHQKLSDEYKCALFFKSFRLHCDDAKITRIVMNFDKKEDKRAFFVI